MSNLIVYTARKIHTMEPSQPVGQAIAVRGICDLDALENDLKQAEMVGPAGLEPATKPL